MKTIVRILMTAAAVMMLTNFASAQIDQHLCIQTGLKSYRAVGGGANPPSSYNWTLPAGAVEDSRTDNEITIDWSGVAAGVYNLTVSEEIAGCAGTVYTFAIEVHAKPTATIVDATSTVCSGTATADISVALTGTANWTITWAINGVDQAPIAAIAASPYTLVVPDGITATSAYTITAISDAYCADGTFTGTVTYTVPTFGTTGIIAL